MRDNLTEIIFILDKSGSMQPLTEDTIGGFNSFIDKQKGEPGEALVTTVLFNDTYKVLYNGVKIEEIEPMNKEVYHPNGMTALYDAVGKTITEVGNRLANTSENDRPSKVIVVITTDGEENASKEYSQRKVKEMITHQTEKYSWEFIFLGANIDTVSAGASIGIKADNSISYTATSKGIDSVYCALTSAISDYRMTGSVDTATLSAMVE